METLNEKIFKIINSYDRQIDDTDYHDSGIINEMENYESLTEEIASLIKKDFVEKEFVEWKDSKSLDHSRGKYYSDTDYGVGEFTLDELRDYWLLNTKNK